ncbi:MAG: glucosamine-6-phosphate deaminase [Planctomycetaceae bacterium]|nr:glucosamine-6-phosphate deaminase [Planctomycetaceae bacterium]
MTALQNLSKLERLKCQTFDSSTAASRYVAVQIADLIRSRAQKQKNCILGLATGSTPVGIYGELVRMHKEEGLSFANVITFNLDEYYPMQPHELQSYVRFMHEHLFDAVDIPPENINIPDGTVTPENVAEYCRAYEQKIADVGGIDIQLLGIGRTGHIGFNEPGSDETSRTRLITLDSVTRTDAASDFFGAENVPRRAITMGVGTILNAWKIFILAFGENKAPIVARTVEGEPSPAVPATYLQRHRNVEMLLDQAAAGELTRSKLPWLVEDVTWSAPLIRRAVIWLAEKMGKAILKLTDAEYNEEGLQSLLAEYGSAYEINLEVFRHLQGTLIGWPGGKPDKSKRPGDRPGRFDHIFPKRVICFSPHPDDDVISMGGTLIRLADQGHEVHVAYQTSGNIAVFDEDAIRFAEFAAEFCAAFGIQSNEVQSIEQHIDEFLRNKKPGQVDSDEVQKIKSIIRCGEARAGARLCGVPNERLCFLDMPFYETGRVKKKPLGPDDIQIVTDLLRRIKPHQIYAAGDLSDPHGTHRICLKAIIKACDICRRDDWYADFEVWMYRGAWQEWPIHQVEMAVPLSPLEVERKRQAIFKHESQKDRALFPGPDMREFWQRAEARNRHTAEAYDKLGLAEYEAIEGFVRWDGKWGLDD